MKNHKTSYPLAIILSVISTVLPVAAGIYRGYVILHPEQSVSVDFGLEQNSETPYFAIGLLTVAIFQWLVLRQPLKKMMTQAIHDNEYDEFGRSKKKSFENLTRKEREELDLQKAAQMEQLLSSSVIKKIIKKGSINPEKDLEKMIGLQTVKTKVNEMVARMKFEQETLSKKEKKERKTYGANGRHFVFYGSAGTGKTTVARIITGFLYEYGYIKENKCVEIDGNFLKAGEMTDAKTKLVIQQAYGGVLFIDEAYTIVDGNANYGKAAIATLIKEMEDNRDKFTVILAGYKNDMKRLLDSNEGFKSRIKEYLEFPDYTVSEMKEIFESMAHSEGFVVSEEALNNYEIRIEKEKRLSSFGNGRTARNILDETVDRHAVNYGQGRCIRHNVKEIIENEENKFVLCGCDVNTVPNKAVL